MQVPTWAATPKEERKSSDRRGELTLLLRYLTMTKVISLSCTRRYRQRHKKSQIRE